MRNAPPALDADRDRCRDPEGEEQREDRPVLEQAPAEITEQRRVHGPQDRRDEDVRREPGQTSEVHQPGREGRRSAAARDEPRHDQDIAAPFLEEVARPVEPALRDLPAEEPFHRRRAEPAADRVGRVVPGERACGRPEDDPLQRQLPAGGLDAADDHRGLTGERRDERVARADPEEKWVRPQRPGQQVDQTLEQSEQHDESVSSPRSGAVDLALETAPEQPSSHTDVSMRASRFTPVSIPSPSSR